MVPSQHNVCEPVIDWTALPTVKKIWKEGRRGTAIRSAGRRNTTNFSDTFHSTQKFARVISRARARERRGEERKEGRTKVII